MNYIVTENQNYLVEAKTEIKLANKEKPSIITRYAYFNLDKKFIKLTEYSVFKFLINNGLDVIESKEKFNFPELDKFHFVEEGINNSGNLVRMFLKWEITDSHIFPVLVTFQDNVQILKLKYDLFGGKILEKDGTKFKNLISESRNTFFPNWTKFLLFNISNNYNKTKEK